jgi:hypothetical protein
MRDIEMRDEGLEINDDGNHLPAPISSSLISHPLSLIDLAACKNYTMNGAPSTFRFAKRFPRPRARLGGHARRPGRHPGRYDRHAGQPIGPAGQLIGQA